MLSILTNKDVFEPSYDDLKFKVRNCNYVCTKLIILSSVGKESAWKVGDPSQIPGLGRSTGERIDYPLQYIWASLVVQKVNNPPAMQETWVLSLWEDSLEKGWLLIPIF